MSLAYRSLVRSAEAGQRAGPGPALAQRLEAPGTLLGIALLLAGPAPLLWLGILIVLTAWIVRGRAATGWLACRSPLDVGWLAILAGSLLGVAASANLSAAVGRLG